MSYGYPDGCSQADHDRAFGESLSEPPDVDVVRLDCGHYDTEDHGDWHADKLLCPDCYAVATSDQISKDEPQRIARTLVRFFVRLEQQIQYAGAELRWKDQLSLCSIAGKLGYLAYGGYVGREFGE
jgi:hypothetical protein